MKFDKKIINTKNSDILYVAVSMGEDSVAVSHYLSQGFRRICLIYINHGTQYSSTAERAFEKYVPWLNCNRRSKYPITGIVKRYDEYVEGMSESDLRDVRYNLITEAVLENSPINNNEVIVCHHLGDCVESYLMNCFNGVPEYMPIPITTSRGERCKIIRPFITTPKNSIVNYIKSNKLGYWVVQDPSNSDTEYSRRNWLRHVVIPEIKSNYAGIDTIVRKRVEMIKG